MVSSSTPQGALLSLLPPEEEKVCAHVLAPAVPGKLCLPIGRCDSGAAASCPLQPQVTDRRNRK